jgi:electron transfer flavoprotein alpha subunit
VEEVVQVGFRGRVTTSSRHPDDDPTLLAAATTVVGIGRGVDPDDLPLFTPLLDVLGAELGATRAVTDAGHVPRSRQIGITGRAVSPDLYVAIGVSGRFNHMVGVRSARTVVAINRDPEARIFEIADIGLVGDYRELVPLLVAALGADAALPS